MNKQTCQQVFTAAKAQRIAHRPFDRISAYKVRESRYNLHHECEVVASIAAYRATSHGYCGPHLVGCTTEDMGLRLKNIPSNIARELGANLIPAVEALVVEGVPRQAVKTFVNSISPRLQQLILDCDFIHSFAGRNGMGKRARLEASAALCDEALDIADAAVVFCGLQGVL